MTKRDLQIAPFLVLLAQAERASGTFPENIDGPFSLAQASVKAGRVTFLICQTGFSQVSQVVLVRAMRIFGSGWL